MCHCCSTKQRFLFNKDFFCWEFSLFSVMWLVLDEGNFFEEAMTLNVLADDTAAIYGDLDRS